MKIIEKKTWPELFQRVKNREKNFDVRLSDFKCKPGDILVLKEWDPNRAGSKDPPGRRKGGYTGRSIKRKVQFVLKTKDIEKFWGKSEVEKHGLQIIGF